MDKMDIIKQLDNSDKHGIVTDEELLQRGVIYGSRARLGEAQRGIFEHDYSGRQTALRNLLTNRGTISRATSLVEESRIRSIKSVNFLGKYINSHENTAALL